MKDCIKVEMKKSLFNKTALFIYAAVTVLAIWHALPEMKGSGYLLNMEMGKDENPMITAWSVYSNWMGADVISFTSSMFFFLLPVIAVLPYGWSLAGEMQSGYIKNVLCRTSRNTYFISKYAAAFTSAAVVVTIPLVVNFLILSLFLPALKIEIIYPYGTLWQRSMWSGLYYEHPLLYTMLYIILDAVFAGLIASISTAVSFFIKNRVTVMLIPFFTMLLIDYLDSKNRSGWELSPIKFLHALPVGNDHLGIGILLFGIILLIGTMGTLWYKEGKYEGL